MAKTIKQIIEKYELKDLSRTVEGIEYLQEFKQNIKDLEFEGWEISRFTENSKGNKGIILRVPEHHNGEWFNVSIQYSGVSFIDCRLALKTLKQIIEYHNPKNSR